MAVAEFGWFDGGGLLQLMLPWSSSSLLPFELDPPFMERLITLFVYSLHELSMALFCKPKMAAIVKDLPASRVVFTAASISCWVCGWWCLGW